MQCARQWLTLQLTRTPSPSLKSCCLYTWRFDAVAYTKKTTTIPSCQETRCSRPTRPCQNTKRSTTQRDQNTSNTLTNTLAPPKAYQSLVRMLHAVLHAQDEDPGRSKKKNSHYCVITSGMHAAHPEAISVYPAATLIAKHDTKQRVYRISDATLFRATLHAKAPFSMARATPHPRHSRLGRRDVLKFGITRHDRPRHRLYHRPHRYNCGTTSKNGVLYSLE